MRSVWPELESRNWAIEPLPSKLCPMELRPHERVTRNSFVIFHPRCARPSCSLALPAGRSRSSGICSAGWLRNVEQGLFGVDLGQDRRRFGPVFRDASEFFGPTEGLDLFDPWDRSPRSSRLVFLTPGRMSSANILASAAGRRRVPPSRDRLRNSELGKLGDGLVQGRGFGSQRSGRRR